MKVITFSRVFPAYHPKKGEPTWFVEKIWAGLADTTDRMQGDVDIDFHEYYNAIPKFHTIRAGNRWKVGDWFSPRFWSGKPYASKQSLITEPIQIKRIWQFRIAENKYFIDGRELIFEELKSIAGNDGLSVESLMDWFVIHPKKSELNEFVGQIICWNEKINY